MAVQNRSRQKKLDKILGESRPSHLEAMQLPPEQTNAEKLLNYEELHEFKDLGGELILALFYTTIILIYILNIYHYKGKYWPDQSSMKHLAMDRNQYRKT